MSFNDEANYQEIIATGNHRVVSYNEPPPSYEYSVSTSREQVPQVPHRQELYEEPYEYESYEVEQYQHQSHQRRPYAPLPRQMASPYQLARMTPFRRFPSFPRRQPRNYFAGSGYNYEYDEYDEYDEFDEYPDSDSDIVSEFHHPTPPPSYSESQMHEYCSDYDSPAYPNYPNYPDYPQIPQYQYGFQYYYHLPLSLFWGRLPRMVICPVCRQRSLTRTRSRYCYMGSHGSFGVATPSTMLCICSCSCFPMFKTYYHHCGRCRQLLGIYQTWSQQCL